MRDIGVLRGGWLNEHIRYADGLWLWMPKREDFFGHGVLELINMMSAGSIPSESPIIDAPGTMKHEIKHITIQPVENGDDGLN